MRDALAGFLTLLIAGCASASIPDRGPNIDVQYRLHILAWDSSYRLMAPSVSDAKLDVLPTVSVRRELLSIAHSDEVQVHARCRIKGQKIGECDDFRVSPNANSVELSARHMLDKVLVSEDSLNRVKVRPTHAILELRVAPANKSSPIGKDCILVSFCGIPTPPPPPVPPPSAE